MKNVPLSGHIFRLGAAIPLVSKLIVRGKIRRRELSISRLASRIRRMVDYERERVEGVIREAQKTDIHSLIRKATSLRDRLEEAACVRVRFPGIQEPHIRETLIPKKVAKPKPINVLCVKEIIKGLFDTSSVTGRVQGRGPNMRFRRADLNLVLDECIKKGGKLVIPAKAVDSLTGGAKNTDIKIEVPAGI